MQSAKDHIVVLPEVSRHHFNAAALKDLFEFQRKNNPALRYKSCADIAEEAGMSESTLKNLLSGKSHNPSGDTLVGLLDVIGGGSLDRLYGYAPPRDYEHESATYDATLMEGMQLQVSALIKERDAISGMIRELSERVEKQSDRLEAKASRIQEQEVEISALNERISGKDVVIANLEKQNSERKNTVDILRRDLKRQRIAMAAIIFFLLILEIAIAF